MKKICVLFTVVILMAFFVVNSFAAGQQQDFLAKCHEVNSQIPTVVKGYLTGLRDCNVNFQVFQVNVGYDYVIYYYFIDDIYTLAAKGPGALEDFKNLKELLEQIPPAE